MSVLYLQEGEEIKVLCPAYLANGGVRAYSQLGSTQIRANTPIYFTLKVLECQPKLEDLISVGRKFFKAADKTPIIGSSLKNWTGNSAYDKTGNLKRTGGGPPPDNEGTVNKFNYDTAHTIEEVQAEVEKNKKDIKKLSGDLSKLQK